MIKSILLFAILWCGVFFGISFLWHSAREMKINMLKTSVYAALTGAIAIVLLATIVALF